MPTKLPITAITGFLGAGKTTLVSHLLEHNDGRNIGVVVNDYGDVNIELQLVASQTDNRMELTNGCICCTLDDMELDEAIAQFAYPGSTIDYVLIEASGLAEPADLAATLKQAAGDHAYLDSVVSVIDAVNFPLPIPPQSIHEQQIEHSNYMVINKTDLADDKRLKELSAEILSRNPRARIIPTVNAQVEPALILDVLHDSDQSPTAAAPHNHTGHAHLHESYRTTSFTSAKTLDPEKFQEFVNQLLPTSIYRAKGIVNFGVQGQNRKCIFQLVGKRADISWHDWDDESPRTELVFIGQDYDEAKLIGQLADCVGQHPKTT